MSLPQADYDALLAAVLASFPMLTQEQVRPDLDALLEPTRGTYTSATVTEQIPLKATATLALSVTLTLELVDGCLVLSEP